MKPLDTEGCPRCQDYDKVKDELESNKRKSQEEQKSALKKCEDSKAQLQKKLLTVGAAAVIAGTVLGKEFVDKIASYIESFNKVKDGAAQLVSQADPPADVGLDAPQETDEPNEEEKEDEKEDAPRSRLSSEYFASADLLDYTYLYPSSQSGLNWPIDAVLGGDPQSYLPTSETLQKDYLAALSDIQDLTYFAADSTTFYMPDYGEYFLEDVPPLLTSNPPVAIVPEGPAFLTFMAAPLFFNRRSRRS
tara:strand:+ start:1335 stop:2078 length:744 start_codon:yes stop_codon:yes gene_type:complete